LEQNPAPVTGGQVPNSSFFINTFSLAARYLVDFGQYFQLNDMLIKDIQPHISLTEFVRKYQIIRWQYEANSIPPNKFLAPRPEHSLTFYIRDLQSYSFLGLSKKETYPKSIVSGIHTNTLIRDCGHDFWALKIIFQPCALFRLTGLPMQELVSNFAEAEAIFGKDVNSLYERLNGSDNLNEMIVQIEIYLQKVISQKVKNAHSIDLVCQQILIQNKSQNLDFLAKQSFLGTRQFIRKFEQRTGISPKLFDRIVRFDNAYRLKNNNPNLDWLSIALDSGYYDYQHLTKDYKDFTNHTPVTYYEIDKKAPERDFGLHFG
jgi:AraC-like DNA-binding protein